LLDVTREQNPRLAVPQQQHDGSVVVAECFVRWRPAWPQHVGGDAFPEVDASSGIRLLDRYVAVSRGRGNL
jgi:hypothetical protein